MRPVHWLFLLSIALFVSGIGFVIAGARSARHSPAAPTAAVSLTPVASVKQIMNAIVQPATTVVFNAVGSRMTMKGEENFAPRTDKEWATVADSAAAILEAG